METSDCVSSQSSPITLSLYPVSPTNQYNIKVSRSDERKQQTTSFCRTAQCGMKLFSETLRVFALALELVPVLRRHGAAGTCRGAVCVCCMMTSLVPHTMMTGVCCLPTAIPCCHTHTCYERNYVAVLRPPPPLVIKSKSYKSISECVANGCGRL